MQVVIIEDEDLAATSLERLLLKNPHQISVKKRLESVEESINWLKNNTCDLIFSDIHLGDGESFEIFETLQTKTPIIFTTAFDKYAIKAFQFYAIDYLLKPYDKENLNIALKKYVNFNKKTTNYSGKLENLLQQISNDKKEKRKRERFLVTKGNQLISLKINEIAYFMAQGKHLFLCTNKGESYLYPDTISNLEEDLPAKDFFKINRKYIVHHNAIKNIVKYGKNRIKIELHSSQNPKELIFISTNRNNDFKAWLNK